MKDTVINVQGFFKIEKIQDGKVVDSFEKKNQVMARVPELFAGAASGYFCKDVHKYVIGAIALGTNGTKLDANGSEIPREVSSDRSMLYSEYDFWNEHQRDPNLPPLDPSKTLVTQMSFSPKGWQEKCDLRNGGWGDQNKSVGAFNRVSELNQGMNHPYTVVTDPNTGEKNNIPDMLPSNKSVYRQTPPVDLRDRFWGKMSLQKNTIIYEFVLDQNFGNNPDGSDTAIGYNEAGVYMKLNANEAPADQDPKTGNPLGELFAMRTFPTMYKNSQCALKITWRFIF